MSGDLNFLATLPPTLSPTPEYIGPNLKSAVKMTPRKFAASVLDVFEKLGGTSWLLTQAIADPKAFLDLLKKLIPNGVQLDDIAGFNINLIDQFGNEVQISQNSAVSGIATGGSPPLDLSSSAGQEDIPQCDIKETF